MHAVKMFPMVNASLIPHISHKPLLWTYNRCADDTATVLLQLAALPRGSGWLSYPLNMAVQCLYHMNVSILHTGNK